MANPAEPTNVTPISAESKLSDAQKRDQLRAKIEAGEKRNDARTFTDQAKNAADSALEFARKHPAAIVGGAIVAGLAIGAMTRPGRRAGRQAAQRGSALAAIASQAALALGSRLLDRVTEGAELAGDRFEDFSDSAATKARGLQRDASYKLEGMGDALRTSGRKAGRKGSRAYRDLRNRLTN